MNNKEFLNETKNKNNLFFRKPFFMLLLLLIITIIIIYATICIRKVIIFNEIKDKLSTFQNLTNYQYEIQKSTTVDDSLQDYSKVQVFFNNDIMELSYSTNNENVDGIIWVNYNTKSTYTLNPSNHTASSTEFNEKSLPSTDGLYQLGNTEHIDTKMLIFNPLFSVEVNDEYYTLNYNISGESGKINIVENIDRNTGIVSNKYEYYTDKTIVTNYNCSTDTSKTLMKETDILENYTISN